MSIQDDKTEQLAPCPFCGGPSQIISVMGDRIAGAKDPPFYGPRKKRVVCSSLYEQPIRDCPGHVIAETEAEVIAAWNRRASIGKVEAGDEQ